jgi:shikimate dehydrogenase
MAEMRRAFVCGHPIAHSRSPLIHGHWLKRYAIAGSYEAVDVAPKNFAGFLGSFGSAGFAGGNVTIPHKEQAFALVSRRDRAAEAIGAVNTLWFEDGALVGGNTDAAGFAANLDQFAPGWRDGGTALVIGAGGAARAVVHALLEAGYSRVLVANRTIARAGELAGVFGPKVSAHGVQDATALCADARLIVNTTAAGMDGSDALAVDLERARAEAIVTDIVYVPLETPFLRAARQRGLRTVDGLGMLLHQAVPGFERWFGVRPAVDDELRAIVVADLERHT